MKGGVTHPTQTPQRGISTMCPTKNPKMGRLEVNTLPEKDFYPIQVNEAGPQHDYMHYRTPSLLDALVNEQTRYNLNRLTGGKP